MEGPLKTVWSNTLDIDLAEIGDNSDFFEMGGDSVAAIRLVAEVREQKLELDIESIYMHPVLSKMATHCRIIEKRNEITMDEQTPLDRDLAKFCADECHVDQDIIEDVFPSPYIPAMLLEGHIKTGSFMTQSVFQLIGNCEIATLRNAWRVIQQENPILRTRVIQQRKGHFQVVVKDAPPWFEGTDLQEYKRKSLSEPFHWGSPLFRYALISEQNSTYMVWTTHHSSWDAWTRNLMMAALMRLLARNSAPSSLPHHLPYKSYVSWQLSLDSSSALSAWRAHLQGFNPTHLENLYPVSPSYIAVSTSRITRSLHFHHNKSPFTTATMVMTAYALAVAHISTLDDILFWTVTSGRQINLPGIESIMGPVVSGVPLRARMGPDTVVKELMQKLQGQVARMASHEVFALQALEEHIGHKNIIQSAINYRPPGSDLFAKDINMGSEGIFLKPRKDLSTPRTANLGLITTVNNEGDMLEIVTEWDENLIQEAKVAKLIYLLIYFLQKVAADRDTKIGDM